MHRLAAVFLTLLLAGSLAACGDDDTDTSAPSNNNVTEAPSDDETDNDSDEIDNGTDTGTDGGGTVGTAGDMGTATVEGTTYAFNEALRCDPDSIDVDNFESQIEAQYFGSVNGERVQLDVSTSEFGGMPMHDVSWAGPEGIFGASFTQIGGSWIGDNDTIYQDSPVVISGDRATGSVVLYDAFTMEEELELDFDVVIPSDTFACR